MIWDQFLIWQSITCWRRENEWQDAFVGWLKMTDMKMADHQNSRAWNCSRPTSNWRTNVHGMKWNCKTGNCRTWKCRTWKWRQKWRQGAKLQENKQSFNSDNITINEVCTVQIFKPKNRRLIHCAYGFIPACAQVGKLSPLYFNLRHFTNRSCNRAYREAMLNLLNQFSLKRSPLLSQFHAALLCPAISCPAFSCPVIWSVNFTSVIFTSSIFSTPACATDYRLYTDLPCRSCVIVRDRFCWRQEWWAEHIRSTCSRVVDI